MAIVIGTTAFARPLAARLKNLPAFVHGILVALGSRGKLMAYESQEAYFETLPDDAKARLRVIQERVLSLIPGATKCMSYNLPAFRDKRIFLYFAAFKKHIGIYPPVSRDAALIQELAKFRGPKGNLSFPLGQPLPMELIERVILALHKEYATK